MSDSEQTVYVVATRGGASGGRANVHTDEGCERLQRAHSYVEKPRSLVPHKDLCSICTGDYEHVAPSDPKATRRRLLDLDPEDAGLPPVGERTQEGRGD